MVVHLYLVNFDIFYALQYFDFPADSKFNHFYTRIPSINLKLFI